MQEAVRAHPSTDSVVTHKLHVHALPFYTVPDTALEVGASLGNGAIWINTKGTGAVERIFSVDVGQSLTGAISIRYAGPGHRPFEEPAGHGQGHEMSSHVSLRPAALGTFEIHPAYQRHRFSIAGFVGVAETTFLPMAGDVQARYDPALRALVAHNASRPETVRVFGVTEMPSGYATSFDFGSVYDPLHVRPLKNSTQATGDILGCLQLDVHLEAGESRSFAFITAVSGQGEAAAVHAYSHASDYESALLDTLHHLDEVLACGYVLTPDPLINQGALWSKVNMLRVMARYPQGPAFTNEPGVSSNVVARDAAWFVYGNDHFRPAFSRALLDAFARLQYPSGKIPEYYSALDGHVADYGLNINDDTPLFVLAVNHHFRATGDLDWLRGIYPAVERAARYIIAQEDARGLVVCTARDPRGGVWAIASWRNIIAEYTLNGAVTEINAACAAALRATGHLAR